MKTSAHLLKSPFSIAQTNKTNERNFFFSQLSKKHKNSLPRLTNALRCLRENSDRKIAVVTTDTQTHAKSIAGIAKPKSKFHFRNSSIFFCEKTCERVKREGKNLNYLMCNFAIWFSRVIYKGEKRPLETNWRDKWRLLSEFREELSEV
jgi:hypothetical protein